MAYPTPYYGPIMTNRDRRRMWQASINDPTMPEHWAEFAGGGRQEFDPGEIDYAGAISGAAGLTADYMGMANQKLGLSPIPGTQRSATGEPIYNLGSVYNEAERAKPQGATGGEIVGSMAKGAQIGTAIAPGIGTAVGAVGAGIGSVVAGGRRKKKQDEERQRALQSITSRQRQFNKASQEFTNQQSTLEDYYRRMDMTNQLYNLYR